MPGLLRLHFAAVGHRDARLAPLTIDLRGEGGGPADSVLWLRNGGGKSSLLNLLFSVLRPHYRDFLGTSAEGRSRRLEDYIQAADLGFVVCEWALPDSGRSGSPGGAQDGAAEREPGSRIVGQMLAWRGQQRSADRSRLRRVFFSVRSDEELGFEDLPITGLGSPCASPEAFVAWLRERGRERPNRELAIEEGLNRWTRHLQDVGLDPELYRYQIKMNQREGAADELFRFSSAAQFVRFLLKLAFDPTQANQVAATLKELQTQLRELPGRQLERSFARAVQARLGPLVQASQQVAGAERRLEQVRQAAGGLATWLQGSEREHLAAAARARARAEEATAQRRRADNELRTLDRWAQGLQRLAARLEVQERQIELDAVGQQEEEWQRKTRLLGACPALRRCEGLRTRLQVLEEELSRRQHEHAPLLDQARQAGSTLALLLQAEEQVLQAATTAQELERSRTRQQRQELTRTHLEYQQKLGAARQQERQLSERLTQRDSERQRLLETGHLLPREEVQAAMARFNGEQAQAAADLERLEGAQQETATRQKEVAAEQARCEALLDTHRPQLANARATLQDAQDRRQHLREDPLLCEIEEVDAVAVEAEGLLGRIHATVDEAEARLLAAQLEGAHDRRCIEAFDTEGLLPPSVDVQRVLKRLTDAGVQAWSAFAYLAQNLRTDAAAKRKLLNAAPAVFAGVLLPDEAAVERALRVSGLAEDLRGPVTLSVCSLEAPREAGAGRTWVVGPCDDGAFDYGAAATAELQIRERVQARTAEVDALRARRQALRERAGELVHYLELYGGRRFVALVERIDALEAELERLRVTSLELDSEATALARQQQEQAVRREERQADLEQARLRNARLAEFLRTTERHVPDWRAKLDMTRVALQGLEQVVEEVAASLATQQQRVEELGDLLSEGRAALKQLRQERARIHLQRAEPLAQPPVPRPTLTEARQRWSAAAELVQQRLGADQLTRDQARLSDELREAETELARALGERSRQELEAVSRAVGDRWEVELAGARQGLSRCQERLGRDRVLLEQAQARLQHLGRRREADDLPTGEAPPTTAAAAQQRAEQLRQRKDAATALRVGADEDLRRAERDTDAAERRAERRQSQVRRLTDAVHTLPGPLPALSEGPGVDELLGQTITQAREARDNLARAQHTLRQSAEQVRQVALSPEFEQHRSVVKERLLDAEDTLVASAARYEAQIKERIAALDAEIDKLDGHRLTLVSALLQVTQSAELLLADAARASRMPDTLGRWAGKAFLHIALDLPTSDEERRARLVPLVDRLASEGTLPDGLRLAHLAIEELCGPRSMRVTLLKPEALRRGDRVPVASMANFSGGERLTTAVLLYCSLVRLRARRRGRARRAVDGGVLVLDNPIGTCSNVALLQLQREVAAAMGVQLVYTTGVDDLAALAQLPNVIRLRNTHRDRSTGDLHVTAESEGVLQAVRVRRRPGKDSAQRAAASGPRVQLGLQLP